MLLVGCASDIYMFLYFQRILPIILEYPKSKMLESENEIQRKKVLRRSPIERTIEKEKEAKAEMNNDAKDSKGTLSIHDR